jgi:hypothetical protein
LLCSHHEYVARTEEFAEDEMLGMASV